MQIVEEIWRLILGILSSPASNGSAQLFIGAVAWVIGYALLMPLLGISDLQMTNRPRLQNLVAIIGATIIAFQVAYLVSLMRAA